jgi:hypothetical protein
MSFKSFDDFDNFENRVNMDADFKSSRISSKDIAYFTRAWEKVLLTLALKGELKAW